MNMEQEIIKEQTSAQAVLDQEKEKRKKTVFYWLDYLKDRKGILIFYFFEVALFLGILLLEHSSELDLLIYPIGVGGVVLIFWLLFDGSKYVNKRKKIALAIEMPEGAAEIFDLGNPDNSELENASRELLAILCNKNRELNAAFEEKSAEQKDYYMMWAHQIKTPISALKLLTKSDFKQQEELLRIEQYVEMVLQYQRFNGMSSDMELKECDLYKILKDTVKKFAIAFINSGLSLKLEETDTVILTDEKWFSFCVEQLLSNSIKYTKAPGEIHISVVNDGENEKLIIEDTGIGIRAQDLPRIFEKGFTGYNGRLDKKATGIGLYLIKRILDTLGNEIMVESEQQKGTKVTINLTKWNPNVTKM